MTRRGLARFVVQAVLMGIVAAAVGVRVPAVAGDATMEDAAKAAGLDTCTVDVVERAGGESVAVDRCAGEMRTHDDLQLDGRLYSRVDSPARQPLVAVLHGWSGSRFWFAAKHALPYLEQGFAVFAYTARGFDSSCGAFDPVADVNTAGGTDPPDDGATDCDEGWTHIAERKYEVADAQYLLGTLVDKGVADPTRVVAVGESYGGGQAWQLAMSLPWMTPAGGGPMQLRAASIRNAWTDLLDALAPNGRSGEQSRRYGWPPGVMKSSVLAMYAAGKVVVAPSPAPWFWGRYNHVRSDQYHSYFDGWIDYWSRGEPYDRGEQQQLAEALRGKSALVAPETDSYLAAVAAGDVRAVPVYLEQAWTDPLFPVDQVLAMYEKLKDADPSYPVAIALGETGGHVMGDPAHSAALRRLEHEFLVAWGVGDGAGAPTGVFALPTRCHAPDGTGAVEAVTAPSWDSLAAGGRRFRSSETKTTSTVTGDPVAEAATDYLAAKRAYDNGMRESSCLTRSDAPTSSWRWPLATPLTIVGLPKIRLDFRFASGKDATVALKLWDYDPASESRTLVARGIARLVEDDGEAGRLTTELSGNHWRFERGHSVELEISQSDAPTFRPHNLPSQLRWTAVDLRLPERP